MAQLAQKKGEIKMNITYSKQRKRKKYTDEQLKNVSPIGWITNIIKRGWNLENVTKSDLERLKSKRKHNLTEVFEKKFSESRKGYKKITTKSENELSDYGILRLIAQMIDVSTKKEILQCLKVAAIYMTEHGSKKVNTVFEMSIRESNL